MGSQRRRRPHRLRRGRAGENQGRTSRTELGGIGSAKGDSTRAGMQGEVAVSAPGSAQYLAKVQAEAWEGIGAEQRGGRWQPHH